MATKPNPYQNVLHLMDPELRGIVEKQKHGRIVAPNKSNIQMLRKGYDMMTTKWHQAPIITRTLKECRERLPWMESMIKIPTRDGYQMRAKVYRPANEAEKLPIVLVTHGGMLCMGSLDSDEFVAQLLCSRSRAVVLNIEYRLFPEYRFPTMIEDTYDALSWIQVHAGQSGSELSEIDLDKGFMACGVSGGGNILTGSLILAAQEMVKARDGKTAIPKDVPRVSGVMMLMTGYPAEMTDTKRGTSYNLYPDKRPSHTLVEDAPIMNKRAIPDWPEFCEDIDIFSPLNSALHIAPESPILDHMPKLWYHQLSGLDMWQDTALLWMSGLLHGKADLLPKQSAEHQPSIPGRSRVKIQYYPGMPHCWWMVWPQISKTKQWVEDMVCGANWVLGRAYPSEEVNGSQRIDSSKL